MNTAAIIHKADYPYLFPERADSLSIRLKSPKNDIIKCYIIYFDKYKDWSKKEELKKYASAGDYDIYQGSINYAPLIRHIKYYFQLIDRDKRVYWLNDFGVLNRKPEKYYFEYSYFNEGDLFQTPDWFSESVFYQIFVDRFYDGDSGNNPENTVPWGSKPDKVSYMGGDIRGIIEKLDYLNNLGVNAIYLSPVFKAYSYHKYDILDYFKLDPVFGEPEDLRELVACCHEYNIKVILDGVFNHCSYYFKPFQDALEKGTASKYYDWFYFDGSCYRTTGYYKLMPKLNLSNPELKDYIFRVVEYWMTKTNIDGWRLDVADEMEAVFLRELRSLVRKVNKKALLIGEIWYNGQRMLKGEQVDSISNYVFRELVIDFFARDKISLEEFLNKLNGMRVSYPEAVEYKLLNIIDSHDTERFLTTCNNNPDRMRLAAGFQFTFTGIPLLFYGDETGLTGENDPDCRQAMVWDEKKVNFELLDWYRKLIKIRKDCLEFQKGDFELIYSHSQENCFVFKREYPGQLSYVFINKDSSPRNINVSVKGERFIELFSGNKYKASNGKVSVDLEGFDFIILRGNEGV
ncbi:MAG TPA: glycoside hydrolase family 13 protein [Halanaerobiales bacterium]|nr:glycoside hydrolase family 13 protein [Halanaerobiales bacterium]